MSRIGCDCDRVRFTDAGRAVHAWRPGDCATCFSFWTNAIVRKNRGGDDNVLPVIGEKYCQSRVTTTPTIIPDETKSPCIYEGPVVESCLGCGNKEARDVRLCYHPSGERDKCTRAHPLSKHQRCSHCKDYRSHEPALPITLLSPREKRPHVWRQGILQIWITRTCDRACYGCTQGSNLGGKPEIMTPDQFKIAVDSIKDYWGVVGIFGGNPVTSPYFDEICKILRGTIPYEQRGLWCNHPQGKGRQARITFNPSVSNLNVHQSQEAWDEFARDWPESKTYLKGLDCDSRHSPPYVALKDVVEDEKERWDLISKCDINKNWSAMIGVFRGQVRGWFCEIAGAQSMLHQHEPDYPDTGVPITPRWWDRPIDDFSHQVKKHCHECGIPLKGYGALANTGPSEQVSKIHESIYIPKRRDRNVELVTTKAQLGVKSLPVITDYIDNGRSL